MSLCKIFVCVFAVFGEYIFQINGQFVTRSQSEAQNSHVTPYMDDTELDTTTIDHVDINAKPRKSEIIEAILGVKSNYDTKVTKRKT